MAISIEPLERRHRPLLGDFDNQHPALVEYLQRFALRHAEKDLLARTFVAVHTAARGPRIAGYFTLATAGLERASASGLRSLAGLPRFPIPGILLARLAVASSDQGRGLGRYLFEEAMGRVLGLARLGSVGFRVFVTDALDESAARFYEHFGLVRLTGSFPMRLVLDLRPFVATK